MPQEKKFANFLKNIGINIVLLLITGITVSMNNDNIKTENIFFVCSSVFCGSLVAWIIYLFVFNSNSEFNDLIEKYSERVNECQSHTNSLQEYCRKIVLKDNLFNLILDKYEIFNLEKNVLNNIEIIVMTSKFVLEKKIIKPIIVDNIRKGVLYDYLIPSDDRDTTDYIRTATIWWEDFKAMLTDKKICLELLDRSNKNEIVFSQDFNALLSRCKEFHEMQTNDQNYTVTENTLRKNILDYFKKKIQTYKINENYSFITIIMYQKDNTSNDWDVIIKLPTSDDNEEYTAYLVPDENQSEKQKLVKSIRRLCDVNQRAKKYDIFSQHKEDFKW